MSLGTIGNIFFTGFMATGKSRIGELTAASLGRTFIDTDQLIEEKTGLTISEIFTSLGEEEFRRLELESVKQICEMKQVVAALGGGALGSPEVRDLVKRSGKLVCLWAEPDVILERANRKQTRPLLANLDNQEKLAKIKRMLREREEYYSIADFRIESKESTPHHLLTRQIIHRLQIDSLKPLRVELGDRSYPIYVEEDLSNHVDTIAEKSGLQPPFIIVTDQNLKLHQRQALKTLRNALGKCRIFFVKPGEDQKNLKSVNKLFTYLIKHQYSRSTTLVSFSGGVVGDMVGFAAAIFLRGVPFLQIPTTLLSMVDSSVGGKTGVNHTLGKNLIGAYHQPKAVAISLHVLRTLPDMEFKAGMAEVVKYGIIRDANFFSFLEENLSAILSRETSVLQEMIRTCCAIKAEVVAEDERESGIRAILNYGHTFGHAIESIAGYGVLTHGYAVALGMRVAARVAVELALFSAAEEKRQNDLLDKIGLPKNHDCARQEELLWEAMGRDKKVNQGSRVYILPTRIGFVKKVADVDKKIIVRSLCCIQEGNVE